MIDYYKILGLQNGATTKEIKQAYRRMALKYHPDKNSSPDAEFKFIRATEAYEVLNNPAKRKEYDVFYKNEMNSIFTQNKHEHNRQEKEKEWSEHGKAKAEEYATMNFELFINKIHQAGKVVNKFFEFTFYAF